MAQDAAFTNLLSTITGTTAALPFVKMTPTDCYQFGGVGNYYTTECDPTTGWMLSQTWADAACTSLLWSSRESIGGATLDFGSFPIASGDVYRATGSSEYSRLTCTAAPPPSPPPSSPPSAPPPDADDNPCFPSSATVVKSDGTASRIDALKEGDTIVAATVEGRLTTDTVSLLSIAKPEARDAAFLVLTTADGKNLTLTPGHHLPVGASCCATLQKASDVRVGESVWTITAGTIRADAVTRVSQKAAAGLHSPVLTSGSFPIVDGVVTSFDSIGKVRLAKHGLAPLLKACKATASCESLRELFLSAEDRYIA